VPFLARRAILTPGLDGALDITIALATDIVYRAVFYRAGDGLLYVVPFFS
jgi:hypothetical protein